MTRLVSPSRPEVVAQSTVAQLVCRPDDRPHTVSEINGDFSRKSQNFPIPVYFAPLLKGFPLELNTGVRGQNTRMMRLQGREISLTISSAVWIQYTNGTDGQTDGHRATAKTALTLNPCFCENMV